MRSKKKQFKGAKDMRWVHFAMISSLFSIINMPIFCSMFLCHFVCSARGFVILFYIFVSFCVQRARICNFVLCFCVILCAACGDFAARGQRGKSGKSQNLNWKQFWGNLENKHWSHLFKK